MRAIGCVVAALLVAPSAFAANCRLSLAASLPLIETDHGSKLTIVATVDGSPVRLIVDTGAEAMLLNEVSAQRVGREVATGTLIGGLDTFGKGFAAGVGGSRAVGIMEIGNLGLGRLHGSFKAQTTSESFARAEADGLMGMSVMGNFDIDIDLAGGQLRLYSAAGGCAAPAVALNEPIYAAPMKTGFRSAVRPLVPVVINGKNFTALLDTGSPGLLLFAGAAATLGLTSDPGPHAALGVTGVGGRSTATRQQVQTLTIGPITLRNVPIVVDSEPNQESDLLIGVSLMRKIHFWISNSSHTLVMQFPPSPSPALGGN